MYDVSEGVDGEGNKNLYAIKRKIMIISRISRAVRYGLEAFFVIVGLALFRALPVDLASFIPGKLVRVFGPLTSSYKRTEALLARFLPDSTEAERRHIALARLENIGRTMGELPHIRRIINDPARFRFDGIEEAVAGLDSNTGAITISGHFGNWELSTAPSYVLKRRQISIYKRIKNPLLERWLKKNRMKVCTGELVPKDANSLRRMMSALKDGHFVGMMVDQREPKGIESPFLGEPAETNHAPALLACRYNVPLIAGIVIREKGARFRMLCKRVPIEMTGDNKIDIPAITLKVNELFGSWVRDYPDQWLWSDRRWRRG